MVFVIPPKLVLPLSSLCGAFVTVLVAVQLEFFFSVGYPINLSLRAINAFSQRLFSAFGFLQLQLCSIPIEHCLLIFICSCFLLHARREVDPHPFSFHHHFLVDLSILHKWPLSTPP